MSDSNFNILSPELTVQALRDSGYRNTAYAIAELIDNSIDARASEVTVVVEERLADNGRYRVHRIAVADNGSGMDEEVLRRALKFGDGQGRQTGRIGRFGMGLPNSSLSQCQHVDVWSWRNGPDNALRTYLDLEEIKQGTGQVPAPQTQAVPEEWRSVADLSHSTGTLVVWSELDRVQWFRADSTFNNTESIIGRVYRRRIANGDVAITLVPVRDGEVGAGARQLRVNDPLYLMAPSTTPAPFDTAPMFKTYRLDDTDDGSATVKIRVGDTEHDVIVRASVAHDYARRADVEDHPWPADLSTTANPGSHPWGKHAGGNVGISVMREGRELDLDSSWANPYDPTERWWGLEIEFPSDLDEIFGVTNNKQAATVFHQLSRWSLEDELSEGETQHGLRDRLREEGDPRAGLIELTTYLHNTLRRLRAEVKTQTKGARPGTKERHKESLNKQASDLVDRRAQEGHTGQTDTKGEHATDEEKRKEQLASLTGQHQVPEQDALAEVEDAISHQLKARWVSAAADTSAFFSVDMLAGMLQVVFNTNHPVYPRLEALLDSPISEEEGDDPEELRRQLQEASTTLKLLLFAWARYEDELSTQKLRDQARDARTDWGRMARDFFADE